MFLLLNDDAQLEPGDYRLELNVPSWALNYIDEHPGFSESAAQTVAQLSGSAVDITSAKPGYRVDPPYSQCLVIKFTVPYGVISPTQMGIPARRVIGWIGRVAFFGFAVIGIYAVIPEPIKDGLPGLPDVGDFLENAATKAAALVVGGVALWLWVVK